MKQWRLLFLGRSEATCGGEWAHLRSKQTWGVLASLVIQRMETRNGGWLSRTTLAERFWPDTDSARTSLRMALASLRKAFGADCLEIAADQVRLSAGWSSSDLSDLESGRKAAAVANSAQRKLQLLMEADALIRDVFLEGLHVDYVSAGVAEAGWLEQQRSVWSARSSEVALELSDALQADGRTDDSFECACRAYRLCPSSIRARDAVWRLGLKADRQITAEVMRDTLSFAEAIPIILSRPKAGRALTLKDQRVFANLVLMQYQSLPTTLKFMFLGLSILPGPFRPSFAQAVTGAKADHLAHLADLHLLIADGERYSMPKLIREFASTRVTQLDRKRTVRKHAAACVKWMVARPEGDSPAALMFASLDEAEADLDAMVSWLTTANPSESTLDIVETLHWAGLLRRFDVMIETCVRVFRNTKTSSITRLRAIATGGALALHAGDFQRAIDLSREGLCFVEALNLREYRPGFLIRLAVACHHAEQTEQAIETAEAACDIARELRGNLGLLDGLRCLAEFLRSANKLSESLERIEEAIEIVQSDDSLRLQLAEYLYQRSLTRRCMADLDGAGQDCLASMGIRQDAGERHGVADCLRELGSICAERGRFVEGRSHIEHAARLYELIGNRGSRAAASCALGDLFRRQGRANEARELYLEAMEYWAAQRHSGWISTIERRIELLELSGVPSSAA